VRYRLRPVTLSGRIELMEAVGGLARKMKYHAASAEPEERLQAARAGLEIDAELAAWGVLEATGLEAGRSVAGSEMTAQWPEELTREAAALVRRQCGLSEAERKN
jgi:hypothetical protein